MEAIEKRKEKFPLMCRGKQFGTKYQIDEDGVLYDAVTGAMLDWDRNVPVDLCKSSKSRTADAGKRWFSKLTDDSGAATTVGKAEAVAWSVPSIAEGRRANTVIVYNDGDEANETAANLRWGTPQAKAAKARSSNGSTGKPREGQLILDEEAKEILAAFVPRCPVNGTSALAARYGVAATTINNIVSCKTHRHIDRAQFADNPHIAQKNYFDDYVPGEGTLLYERYVRLGRIVKAVESSSAPTEAVAVEPSLVPDDSTNSILTAAEAINTESESASNTAE